MKYKNPWDQPERRLHVPRSRPPGVSEAVLWYGVAFLALLAGLLWWLKP